MKNPVSKWKRMLQLLVFVSLGLLAGLSASASHGLVVIVLLVLAPVLIILVLKGVSEFTRDMPAFFRSFKWWHGLWLLVFLSGLVFRARGLQNIKEEPIDAWAVFRMSLEGIVALFLAQRLLVRKSFQFRSLLRGLVAPLTIFTLVCVISTVWSVYPAWTCYKSLEFLVDVSLLAAILASISSVETFRSLFNWTWTLLAVLLATVWAGVLIWPSDALMPSPGMLGVQLYGVMPAVHPNSVGEYGAILAIVAIARFLFSAQGKSQSYWYALIFGAALVTMVLAQGRSAFAGFLVGLVLMLLFSRRIGLLVLVLSLAATVLSLEAARGTLLEFLQRGESQETISTLSSRLIWWQFAWQKFLERPLIGYGAFAAGRFLIMAQLGMTDTSTVHSDFVEVLVGTGLLGLTPVIIALLGTWKVMLGVVQRSSQRLLDDGLALEALGVLGVITVRSVFTTDLFAHPPVVFFVVLGYAEMLRRQRATAPVSLARTGKVAAHRGDSLAYRPQS